MRGCQRIGVLIGVLGCAIRVGVGASEEAVTSTHVVERVNRVLADFAAGTLDEKAADEALNALHGPDVVGALVHSIESNGRDRFDVRLMAYRALIRHNGVADPQGRAQLLIGLNEAPEIQRLCCEALDRATVAAALRPQIERLQNPILPTAERAAILRSLSGWGRCAVDAAPVCRQIFEDRAEEESLRWAAARCLLGVEGMEETLSQVEILDSVGQKTLIGAVARLIGQEHGRVDGSPSRQRFPEDRMKAQDLVNKFLSSPDDGVRKAALEAFGTVWGSDLVIIGENGEYDWNPEPRRKLEAIARDDPQPELRQKAREMLNVPLEHVVRRVKRISENPGDKDKSP